VHVADALTKPLAGDQALEAGWKDGTPNDGGFQRWQEGSIHA